ncbi:PREDICTED: mediator of RNA polymerase II transcription subunit 2-like [Ceratosolen solmsi marchali]|uniref:Mediator of RNA polymerase II transcription subunit 2-like n=1 Tax=Ceratosolen solmsi marchali TaxID=326594 RepID=A0AAJ6YC58_9HYME|nr:PREDICTED: mediator of RNA polymerase II transcription subunit 2-like [Ceratosolen solmsi marchali]
MSETMKIHSSNACSKDHKSRERASIEKYEKKLMTLRVPKISATQKYIYIFGDVECNLVSAQKNSDNYVDGKKLFKVISKILFQFPKKSGQNQFKSKKMKTNFLKRQESFIAKDLQLLDIEKQLKNIQSQKQAINKLIYKDLKTIKYNWQDVKNKANLKNKSYSNFSYVKKLCDTLDKTSLQVDSLCRSFTEFDQSNINRFDSLNAISKANNTFELTYDKGDSSNITQNKNYNEPLHIFSNNIENNEMKQYVKDSYSNLKVIKDNEIIKNRLVNYASNIKNKYNEQMEKMSSNPENKIKMVVNINDCPSIQDNNATNNSKQLLNGPNNEGQLSNKDKCMRTDNSECLQPIKKICNASNQADTATTANFMNKYPVYIHSILPKIFNSKYLRKSCGFD